MAVFMNDEEEQEFYNFTLYGKSGAGKTTLGVTAPDPFIMLSERQGYQSVKQAAQRLGKPRPPAIYPETLDDVRHILAAFQTDHETPIATALRRVYKNNPDVKKEDLERMIASLPYQRPRTLVLDSATDLFALISDDIERIAGKKIGKDGLEAKPERYWGVLRDRSEKLIRSFRDLPYHVLFLALLKDGTIGEGEEQSRVIEPAAPMKALPGALAAAVNAVGIVFVVQEPVRDKETKEVTYEYKRSVRFAGPSWMMTKPLRPLRDVEAPDVTSWLARLAEHEEVTEPLDLDGAADHVDGPHADTPDDAPDDDAEEGQDAPEAPDAGDDTPDDDAAEEAPEEGEDGDESDDDDDTPAADDSGEEGDEEAEGDTPAEAAGEEPEEEAAPKKGRRRRRSSGANA